jgi:hypothetical protein
MTQTRRTGPTLSDPPDTTRQPTSASLQPNLPPPGYIRGTDGKVYPYRRLTDEQRASWVGKVHYLHHAERLSIRDILNTLQGEGFYCSVGTVHAWLKSWRCTECSGGAKDSPEHSTMDDRKNSSAAVGAGR